MARRKREVVTQPKKNRRPPARTAEGRENQMVSLAVDLAEKQLSEGTASSQVIVHYLKLGSISERLEREKLIEENRLLRAKTESFQSQKRIEELYEAAISAIRTYSGQNSERDTSDDPSD